MKAAPNSYVGLLAVDQSVLLLKTGNDITRELVEQDVEEYDTTTRGVMRPFWGGPRWGRRGGGRFGRSDWYPWSGIGGKDAGAIFEVRAVMLG